MVTSPIQCEHCRRHLPDVKGRWYSRPSVPDPAARDLAPGPAMRRELYLCDECAREAELPTSPTRIWIEKRLAEPL